MCKSPQASHFLAKQAVDLISRKVSERSQALRLWSRTTHFQNFLVDSLEQPKTEVERLLRIINDDYPVYRNILLLNANGEIKACSRPSRLADKDVRSAADQVLFMKAMQSRANAPTQIIEAHAKLLDNSLQTSLVFAHGIRSENGEGAPTGVLVCFFDWQTEASEILNSCLPKPATSRSLPGSLAFVANREQVVLDSINRIYVKIG